MDVNEYLLGIVVHQRLAEARESAQRAALAASLRPPRRPLRAVVGGGLIRLGRLLAGPSASGGALAPKAS